MAYPSTFSTFNRPGSSDRLNNPSHSALHNTVSSALGQVEAVIGLSGNSSTLGTIIGDLRSPDSNGGGHVQTANKGGTGQTSYTKGDLLVATSSSVLAKLAVSSTTGEILTADTTQAAGLKWAAPAGQSKISINTGSVIVSGGPASVAQVLFATSILGSTLGTGNAVRLTGAIQNIAGQNNVEFVANYGNNVVASVTMAVPGSGSVLSGTLEFMMAGRGGVSSQIGWIKLDAGFNRMGDTFPMAHAFGQMTSSVESSGDQNLVITGRYVGGVTAASILTGLSVVEKII